MTTSLPLQGDGGPTHRLGWELHAFGPKDADRTILCIPGGLCGASFFDDIVTDVLGKDPRVRLVTTTIPGYAGTRPLEDMSQESYVRTAADLAKELSCDIVVGHSMGANIAIEMAASGKFSGPVVLLSPAFSSEAEGAFFDLVDRLGRIPLLGPLLWKGLTKMIISGMTSQLRKAHREAMATDLPKNDADFFRTHVRHYRDYLHGQDALVSRFCGSGVRAWVVLGGPKDALLKDDERSRLKAATNVTLVDWPAAGHFTIGETQAVAGLLLDALAESRKT
jgi:pimeloyl-ACP methyl ester carboxylesterase